jgi:farnesyl-diphosphate farnesyltransferase
VTPAGAAGEIAAPDLLREILPGVSRSFALSLRILPRPLRRPFGVTYLVARAADTIADTRALAPAARLAALRALRAALSDGARAAPTLDASGGSGQTAAERTLLAQLPDVLAAYRALEPGDRERALGVLLTLTQAMVESLERFPPEMAARVGALETRADLDRYTQLNAGCVGEFWTDMVAAHRPRCARWDLPAMRARGARFGQGLQLVNVLRDLPRDLRIGRCYLPRTELAALGLAPEDLLSPAALPRARPLLDALIDEALARLDAGRAYTLAVPRRETRLRLASFWPLLIGLGTLARLRRAENLLEPAVTVKVPRGEVRRLLAGSLALVWSDRAIGAWVRRLAAAAAPRVSRAP